MRINRPSLRPARLSLRNRGCLQQAVIVMLALFACTLFTCGTSLIVYMIALPEPVNVLVVGVDARSGEGLVTRTDSIMLLGFRPREFRASALSIPRDLFIQVPGYGLQRVNTINVLGEMEQNGHGMPLLEDSIALSFDIDVDNYIRLNFAAFEALIDAVGGVTITVERRVYDPTYPTADYGVETVIFEVGEQHMDGATALKYARTRHSDDDYFRAGRQQQVMSAFSRKLINPLNWPAVTAALVQHVDSDLSPVDVIKIAPVILIGGGGIERRVIDRESIVPIQGGAAPDYAQLVPWIAARFR